MNRQNLGWVVSGVLALAMAGMVGAGFQAQNQKIGTVSMAKVFNDSAYAKTLDQELKNLGANRKATLDFIDAYRMLSNADLKKFRDLSVKNPQTAADKAEIEKVRASGVAADQKLRELQTKANATEAERNQLSEMQKRVQDNSQYVLALQQEFTDEVRNRQENMRTETLDRVKQAIADVAAKQGYSLILSDEIAPYSANDLTTEAMKAMDAKK